MFLFTFHTFDTVSITLPRMNEFHKNKAKCQLSNLFCSRCIYTKVKNFYLLNFKSNIKKKHFSIWTTEFFSVKKIQLIRGFTYKILWKLLIIEKLNASSSHFGAKIKDRSKYYKLIEKFMLECFRRCLNKYRQYLTSF